VEHGDLTGAILDGRYRVMEPVAEGAMGVVYRAERVKLGRIVAIKVLHDVLPNELSSRKRFEIEAMAMAKLEHPHCASVLDVGVHGDRPYVVMDFVSGQNLKDLIAQGPQPIPRATEIVRQVLSGLAHAHELGIIHRDIKPANLVLSQKAGLGDHVKILDFGLARLHDTGQNLTTGLVVGTPAYMAPEQIRGLKLDHRVDLYACGVLLFELLTGHKPFHSEKDDPIEVCKMHLSDPIPRLDAMRPGSEFGELEAVVAKALAKQRDDRYASAQDYAAAIDAIVPRRPSLLSMPPAAPAPSGSIQLASADVMEIGDLSYPPSLEVRSADVLSAITESPPASGDAAIDVHARTAALPAGIEASEAAATSSAGVVVRVRTATPPAGISGHVRIATPPAGVTGASSAPPAEGESPPGTFLGMAVAPPTTVHRATSTSPSIAASATSPSIAASAASPSITASATSPSITAASTSSSPVTTPSPSSSPSPPPVTSSSPAAAPRSSARRRRMIVIAGASLIAAAGIALVVHATRGATPVVVPEAGIASGAVIDSATPPDPGQEILTRVNDLLAQGDREMALDLLTRSRRQYPGNAVLPYVAGKIYFSKYYWTDGLKSFRDAIRNDPAYRTDPELIKIVLRGFITTPSYNDELASFLREDVGSAAQPLLEETARDHPNPAVRSRAASELRRYH
jgi:serine/threonine protein kinase